MKEGLISEVMNICKPVLFKIEDEALESAYTPLPCEEGIGIFTLLYQKLAWRKRLHPKERHVKIVETPAKSLIEGLLFVEITLTLESTLLRLFEYKLTAFQVVNTLYQLNGRVAMKQAGAR